MASQNGASWLIEAIIFVIRLFAMSSSEDVEEIKETDNIAHPWPYLSSMFAFKSINGMKVKLSCLLCCPKGKECSASLSSLSNLRTHVKRAHPHQLSAFNKLYENGKKRKPSTSTHSSCGDSEGPGSPKQPRLDMMLATQLNSLSSFGIIDQITHH